MIVLKYMKREFTAAYQKSGKWFLAWVEEIPGVNTQGRTLREAKSNLKEALRLVIEANREILSHEFRSASKPIRKPLKISIPA